MKNGFKIIIGLSFCFTISPGFAQEVNSIGMQLVTINPGMFAALSFDEGKTWPVKKLSTDGKERFLEGGAWTGAFKMDSHHAEPADTWALPKRRII